MSPAALAQPFAGTVFRAHHPRWAYAPTSGDGAARFGGRFNRPGRPALYTALSPTTAWMEAQQGFPFKAQPMTLVAYRVDCAGVIDLTDRGVTAALGIEQATLACPWEDLAARGQVPPTWDLAEDLIADGCQGALGLVLRIRNRPGGPQPDPVDLVRRRPLPGRRGGRLRPSAAGRCLLAVSCGPGTGAGGPAGASVGEPRS